MEYEGPSLEQIQGTRIERLALALARGKRLEGNVRTRIFNEVLDSEEQVEVLKFVLQRARVLIKEQKRRYLIFGTIWILMGLVPLILGLFLTRGSLLLLTAGPIIYGVFCLLEREMTFKSLTN